MRKHLVDNITIRGYAHILADKECQDYSVSWQDKRYSAAIVCDGHGGDKYIRSAAGSRFACETGKRKISVFMECLVKNKSFGMKFFSSERSRNLMLEQLANAIIQEWNKAVESDCRDFPIAEDPRFGLLSDAQKQDILNENSKAYGTTFLAAVFCEDFYFILKLGDGNVCVIRDGSVEFAETRSAGLRDDRLQFNLTTSLCSGMADREFKYAFENFSSDDDVRGIILTTDGVINSFTSEDAYFRLIGNIFSAYAGTDAAGAKDELTAFLNEMSEKGSGDDLSVAVICRLK